MTHVVDNSILHFEHKSWKNELLFWEDEIKTFKNRVKEIEDRWTDDLVLAELGQYERFFEKQLKRIALMKADIETHEHNIADHVDNHNDAVDRIGYLYHMEMRENLNAQRTIYQELKRRFFTFLGKYF
ncbi:hypothetical protein [Robertkochia aurantiaca]|uniref:hypothetical protein n=1 Tax=Robertkochia aurantiaca TaxID=2873700 RepID=UPI001CCBB93E|nr:hypothetical protein [Robertkochia sp. 3YJGBD-33]